MTKPIRIGTRLTPAVFIAVSLMLFQSFHARAQTGQSASAGAAYNFAYKIAGDRAVAPVQAFDNGSKIYLQFRDLSVLPAVFADTPVGKVLLRPGEEYDIEAPFVVLRNIEPELILMMNKRQATVSYGGPQKEFISQTPVMYGAKPPLALSGAVRAPVAAGDLQRPATSVKRAVDLPLAQRATPDTSKTVAPVPEHQWVLKAAHHSLREALEDWAAEVGYDVVWETREFPLDLKKDKVISTGDFWDALSKVGEAYRLSDAPFQIRPTDFKQIVIVPMGRTADMQQGASK